MVCATLSAEFPSLEVAVAACAAAFIVLAWGFAGTTRLPFLLLWPPSALGAAVVYRLDGHGLSVVQALNLVLHRDAPTLELLRAGPGGADLIVYAVVVGAAVAVVATLVLHFLGLVVAAAARPFIRSRPVPVTVAAPVLAAPRPAPPAPPFTPEPYPDVHQIRLVFVTSLILFTARRTATCRLPLAEIRRQARRTMIHNLLLGWWGIPYGPIFTTIALWSNHRALRHAERLAEASAAPTPATPVRPRREAGMGLAVAGLTLVLLAVAAGAVVVHQQGSAAAPAHPAAWDPRLSDIVAFVEKDRGLAFKQPVFVDFVPAAAFERDGASEVEAVDGDGRRVMEQSMRLLRAVGLLEGDVDLVAKLAQLNAEGVLAFYDPETERITVRGTELTEDVKTTLAHELTHVLQDQHFGLDRLGDEESDWLRGVAEGDAERVEGHWVDHLDPAARKAYDRASEAAGRDADLDGIPEVLLTFMGAPYEFGEGLVELLAAVGGNPAIDRALANPPVSDEQILDPFRYLAGDAPRPVASPELQPGEKLLPGGEADDFGALQLFLVLAQRTDARQALRAVDGWGGDSMIAFERGGRSCIRVAVTGDTPTDTDELGAALERWAGTMPAALPVISRRTGVVEFSSCDPGGGFHVGPSRLGDAIGYPLARTWIGVDVINEAHVSWEKSRCYAGAVVDQITPEQMTSDAPMSRSTQRKLAGAARSCLS